MSHLFESSNYREFLKKSFPAKGRSRGRRRELAEILGCQTSFISQVLTDRAHFSEDMIFRTAQFLRLNSSETEFLLLLYHLERAGSEPLRNHYRKKIKEALEKRSQVKERVGAFTKLPLEVQAQYYSSWSYAAIQTMIMNPQTRTIESIARKLNISQNLVEEQLNLLEQWQLVKKEGNQYQHGIARLHLEAASPFIVQHHRNWMMEAMRAVGEKKAEDLNYSGALSLSRDDVPKIREILLSSIGTIEKLIAPSPDEETIGLNVSFFKY